MYVFLLIYFNFNYLYSLYIWYTLKISVGYNRNTGAVSRVYTVSQYLCHKLFLGIPHAQISKKVPINMGLKVNGFRDIQCCVEIREL